ncbi:MAG: ABC transporter substrate-binding protein [Paracoccaceae bacterium]
MKNLRIGAAAGLLMSTLGVNTALAEEPITIGMITTLSTGAGYLGEGVRDGFMLAVQEEGGKLGGHPVNVLVEDDGRKPGNGKQIVDRFLEREGAEIITGVIFSNVSPVVAPAALKAGAFYLTPNSAPSTFAGKKCHENYFAVAWQNDTLFEAAGTYANDLGYKNAFIMAPNYQAGKDALAGFKRYFDGEIVDEVYTQLGQTDYAAEIARIRDAKPEMVNHFLPGGMGINFLKQYAAAGLADEIPLVLSQASMDLRIMGAVGDSAVGVRNTAHWNLDFDNEANKAFVAGFQEAYGRAPTTYAAQGYDTAKLIASALAATGGKVKDDPDGFRAALKAANFDSVRGEFAFNTNQHPIHNYYGRVVEKDADGNFVNKTVGLVSPNHKDAYAEECKLK